MAPELVNIRLVLEDTIESKSEFCLQFDKHYPSNRRQRFISYRTLHTNRFSQLFATNSRWKMPLFSLNWFLRLRCLKKLTHYKCHYNSTKTALQMSQNEETNRIPFTLLPSTKPCRQCHYKKNQNSKQWSLISFKRSKNVSNFLVKSAFKSDNQPGTFKIYTHTMQNLNRSTKITEHCTRCQ